MKHNRRLIASAVAASPPPGNRMPLGLALDLMDDRGLALHFASIAQLQVANMLVPGDIGDFDTATLIEVL
jgi:hypothetical protein